MWTVENCAGYDRSRLRYGTVARLGVRRPVRYFRVRSLAEGGCVAWILRLVKVGVEGRAVQRSWNASEAE